MTMFFILGSCCFQQLTYQLDSEVMSLWAQIEDMIYKGLEARTEAKPVIGKGKI